MTDRAATAAAGRRPWTRSSSCLQSTIMRRGCARTKCWPMRSRPAGDTDGTIPCLSRDRDSAAARDVGCNPTRVFHAGIRHALKLALPLRLLRYRVEVSWSADTHRSLSTSDSYADVLIPLSVRLRSSARSLQLLFFVREVRMEYRQRLLEGTEHFNGRSRVAAPEECQMTMESYRS